MVLGATFSQQHTRGQSLVSFDTSYYAVKGTNLTTQKKATEKSNDTADRC